MHLKNLVRGSHRMMSLLMTASFLLMIIGGAAVAAAQTAAASQTEQELKVSDLLKLPGKILGEGINTKATGKYKVANYRVEEVALPRTMEVEIHGQKIQASRAFRLNINGGPFPVRAMPPVIWIDDVPVGYGIENEDLNTITVVTFDSSLLTEGSTIYLSYGDKEDKSDRVALPEKLKLDGPKGANK
ncbi:MAG: hypothetical protein QOF02_1853 [Blastocatellia bacterium]|nr:hypothetical protein [Blastocatellia bacterium]